MKPLARLIIIILFLPIAFIYLCFVVLTAAAGVIRANIKEL